MVSWIIIGILVLIIAIIFIKMQHSTKRIQFVLLVLLIVFIYFSASAVLQKNNIKLNSFDNAGKAISLYFAWLESAGTTVWNTGGQVVHVVGNAIKGNSSAS